MTAFKQAKFVLPFETGDTTMNKISRREALMFAAFAGGSVLLPAAFQHRGYAQRTDERVEPFTLAFRTPPVLNPVRSDSTT
ncbi:MAG: hypothetical protein ACR2LR_25980, partial [Hassallia sp.]